MFDISSAHIYHNFKPCIGLYLYVADLFILLFINMVERPWFLKNRNVEKMIKNPLNVVGEYILDYYVGGLGDLSTKHDSLSVLAFNGKYKRLDIGIYSESNKKMKISYEKILDIKILKSETKILKEDSELEIMAMAVMLVSSFGAFSTSDNLVEDIWAYSF